MSSQQRPGRHRSPKRHNPVAEIAGIVRDAAPTTKSLVAVAASGGMIGAFAQSAQADTLPQADNAHVALAAAGQSAVSAAPSVLGPQTSTAHVSPTALTSLGFNAHKRTPAKPITLVDRVHERTVADAKAQAVARAKQREAAKAKAAAAAKVRAAAAAKASAAARTSAPASRTTTRTALAAKTAAKATTTRTTTTATTATTTSTRGGMWGTTSSYNWASAGQCTWGAQNMFYRATGTYLGGFYGNASTWAYRAAGAGWTVTSAPRARAVLVMQPGVHGSSSAGHVAWVTSVSGNKVTIVEMNALAGPYRYNTRTLTHTGGMRYILAP